MLFAGDYYYPAGGWRDFRGSFETIVEAREAALKVESITWERNVDWWHIVDLLDDTIVAEGGPQ